MKLFINKLPVIALLLISFWGFTQPHVNDLIKFEKDTHSFGKVKQNQPVTYEFSFTNPSKKPLIIEDATAECGCTTPVFPKTPILGGKKGSIKVTYDAKNLGSFTKKVTVKLVNVTETKILTINGEVIQ